MNGVRVHEQLDYLPVPGRLLPVEVEGWNDGDPDIEIHIDVHLTVPKWRLVHRPPPDPDPVPDQLRALLDSQPPLPAPDPGALQ